MFVFLTQDLMILSSARSALPPVAVLKQATSVPRLRELVKENEIRLLMVDLQTPGLKLDDLFLILSESGLLSITVAFAQHVNVEVLEEARLQFPDVMTRGQFNAKLPKLLMDA